MLERRGRAEPDPGGVTPPELGWRRARVYPFVGLLLAQGAPLGLLVTRAVVAGRWPTPGWATDSIAADPVGYAYLTLSTSLVFVVLGVVLGRRADRLILRAYTDPLTGLPNRRQVAERLTEEIARSRRYDTPLSLLLVDLDHLKTINDEEGHEAGDRALRALGEVIRDTSRMTDVTGRFGGDEFAVVAPETRAGEAAELAERIRRSLAEKTEEASVPTFTVSIGVADLRRLDDPDAHHLYAAADRALYEAKERGRDRVEVAGDPASQT